MEISSIADKMCDFFFSLSFPFFLFLFLHRQEALLAAISEKDANIALLELSSSKKKKTQEEVAALKREKDSLVHQLKQQVRPACTVTRCTCGWKRFRGGYRGVQRR